ncbi:MAG TPA: N-6 DNA methylase [Candidatus Lokiarchaeia archaeon]|nr:N-6 DNA methylase [Candidatus Lokiarchaeia archaeon]
MVAPFNRKSSSKLLAGFDEWHAALGKIQFTCDPAIKQRCIKAFVLKLLVIEQASCKHALPESWLLECWDECVHTGNIQDLFLGIDAILKDLFDLDQNVFDKETPGMLEVVDAGTRNIDHLRVTISGIISAIKAFVVASYNMDILGSYYEHHIATSKNKRGIVYTPAPICKYILARTEGAKLRMLIDRIRESIVNENENESEAIIHRIVMMRILDPACGTGPFLLEALNVLWNALDEIRSLLSTSSIAAVPGIDFDNREELMASVLQRQVHGIDEDPVAVELARISIFLQAIMLSGISLETSKARFVLALRACIRNENALQFVVENAGELHFDVVIGNPPYVNYKKYGDRASRDFLQQNFRVFNGQADLSYYFFELHHRLLDDDGISGQVSSRYFMQASHAVKLRELLVEDRIEEIDDMNDTNVFKGVGIHPLLYFFTKAPPNPGHSFPYRSLPPDLAMLETIDAAIEGTPFKVVRQASLDARCWCMLSDEELSIKEKFEAYPELGTLGECLGGAETGFDEAFIKHVVQEGETFIGSFRGEQFSLEPELIHPWLKNGDINEYYHAQKQWCIYVLPDISEQDFEARYPGTFAFLSCFREALESRDNGNIIVPWYSWRRPRNVKNLAVPSKIVLPYKAQGIRASIDTSGAYCSYDVTIFVPRASTPSITCIAGILNSKAIAWYFATYGKKMGEIYEFYSGPIAKIRIPVTNFDLLHAIETRVNNIMALRLCLKSNKECNVMDGELLGDIGNLQQEIDALVFRLFSLNLSEIQAIMASLGTSEQELERFMALFDAI